MNQESDERLLRKAEAQGPNPPPVSHRSSGPSKLGTSLHYHPPVAQTAPAPPAEDELLARLRELRRQRQQSIHGPMPVIEFQRRGLPTPPPPQPPLKELLRQWWQNGPFAGKSLLSPDPDGAQTSKPVSPYPSQASSQERQPGIPTASEEAPSPQERPGPRHAPRASSRKLPAHGGQTQPLDERARAWLTQSRETIAALNAKAQEMVEQAKDWISEKSRSHQQRGEEEFVSGLIVVGFAPEISREEGIQRIAALGGRPLRYKAALNLYQVAVPPGQERMLIQHYLQQPGVVSASLEHPGVRR